MSGYKVKRQKSSALRQIGAWATAWWGLTCVYILMLVWWGRNFYFPASRTVWSEWLTAIHTAFNTYVGLKVLLVVIAAGWIVGGWVWLRALKHHKIGRAEALKDLFFTIRK